MILRGIVHVLYYHVFLYISCYIAEIWITFRTGYTEYTGTYHQYCPLYRIQLYKQQIIINYIKLKDAIDVTIMFFFVSKSLYQKTKKTVKRRGS